MIKQLNYNIVPPVVSDSGPSWMTSVWEQISAWLAVWAEASSQNSRVSRKSEINMALETTRSSCDSLNVHVSLKPYHGLFARLYCVALQETDKDHLHGQDGVTHPNAVARAEAEWHERVWI